MDQGFLSRMTPFFGAEGDVRRWIDNLFRCYRREPGGPPQMG